MYYSLNCGPAFGSDYTYCIKYQFILILIFTNLRYFNTYIKSEIHYIDDTKTLFSYV